MALRINLPAAPAGSIKAGMLESNALTQSNLENQIKRIQAQYAPLTTLSEAASKMTYANLMAPQFISKMMQNPDIMANLTEPQRKALIGMTYQAGTGQQLANQLLNGTQLTTQQTNPFTNFLRNIFLGGQPQSTQPMQQKIIPQPSSTLQIPPAPAMKPGEAVVLQPDTLTYTQPKQVWSDTNLPNQVSQQNESYFEKAGREAGIKEAGKEAGRIRAKDINELSDVVFNARTKQQTLDNLTKIISSPEFEKMRQTPILGSNELQYYQRYGTPEQQNMVGQLVTLSGNIVRDASQDFKGSFRKGEQELIQNMKINPGDTFDAARGKMEQLSTLNQMIMKRAELTGNYMEDHQMSKLKAETLADRQVNGDAIRTQVHHQLNPKPTDADINFMAQKYKTTPDEIRKRLKAKGLI